MPSMSAALAEVAVGPLQRAGDEQLLELALGVVVADALVDHFVTSRSS